MSPISHKTDSVLITALDARILRIFLLLQIRRPDGKFRRVDTPFERALLNFLSRGSSFGCGRMSRGSATLRQVWLDARLVNILVSLRVAYVQLRVVVVRLSALGRPTSVSVASLIYAGAEAIRLVALVHREQLLELVLAPAAHV